MSYSHADAAFARRLHRRLEAYRLPRRLVGRPTPFGPVPARLSPIFRDREDLAAAEDLSAEVRSALAASERLIVVCSPASANSTWVAREIAIFEELHPDAPILLAVASGEPAEVFPERFRGSGREPLAADLRRAGDGPHLGLLKLVAGACGVGLDDLVQRDAHRRVRGLTAIAAGAVALAAAMALLAGFALEARAESDRQREGAERLVEFMVTDLGSTLEKLGRLDVMAGVTREALSYYQRQNPKRLPPHSLETRARVLIAMGKIDDARGDLPASIRQFREAHITTAALLRARPEESDRIFNHAQSEFWVAFIDWRQGRVPEAEAGFKRYAALAGQLLAMDAKRPDWQVEAGYAESNLGMLLLRDRHQAREAEIRFRRALAHFEAALTAKPSDPTTLQQEIADGYGWLADSQRAQGRFDEARQTRRAEADLLARLLADDPRNAEYARDLLGNSLGVAQIDFDAGLFGAAQARLSGAYVEAAALARSDPTSQVRAKQQVAIGLLLAQAMIASGARTEAVQRYLAPCRGVLVAAEPELRDLCAVVAAHPTLPHDSAAADYLNRHRARLMATRQSARWGVDFKTALERLEIQREDAQ